MTQIVISIPYNKTAVDVGEIKNIIVNIKSSSRIKGISIKLDYIKNIISLTHSVFISENKALDFLRSKYDWIYLKFANKIVAENKYGDSSFHLENGSSISICGQLLKIFHNPLGKGIYIKDGNLYVSGDTEFLPRRVKDFAKKELMTYIKNYISQFSDFSKMINKISIKDTISRWGSCSSDCKLSFSFRIAFAPQFVIDYVIVHELCHLKEMNHGKDFWSLVYSIYPEILTNRAIKWLNKNGFLLHKI